MRCLDAWRNSGLGEDAATRAVGSLPRQMAEKRDAPVREVCLKIAGSMRSIAALRRWPLRDRVRHDAAPSHHAFRRPASLARHFSRNASSPATVTSVLLPTLMVSISPALMSS